VVDPEALLLIDAANVVGSRPTGWWRDRARAARDLVERIETAGLDEPVVVVLEGAARAGVPEREDGPVRVVHAPGTGDDTLAALAAEADGPVTLVSADRGLAERARRAGAAVVGPRWLLDRLDRPGRLERGNGSTAG